MFYSLCLKYHSLIFFKCLYKSNSLLKEIPVALVWQSEWMGRERSPTSRITGRFLSRSRPNRNRLDLQRRLRQHVRPDSQCWRNVRINYEKAIVRVTQLSTSLFSSTGATCLKL